VFRVPSACKSGVMLQWSTFGAARQRPFFIFSISQEVLKQMIDVITDR
jgi:hypothetical protein